MIARLELTLANQKSEIAEVQDGLEAFLRKHGLAARIIHSLQLALEEHLTNIISYGYRDAVEHQIRIQVQLNSSELRVAVQDDAMAFNPLEHPVPDISKPIEERPVGGLGIHMMRRSLDGMEYRREDGKNVLTMIKRLSDG